MPSSPKDVAIDKSVPWQIVDREPTLLEPGSEGTGHRWRIARGAEGRRVEVVFRSARPDKGRSAVEGVLAEVDPPSRIVVGHGARVS